MISLLNYLKKRKGPIISLIGLLFCINSCFAQSQVKADSLKKVLLEDHVVKSDSFQAIIIRDILNEERNADAKIIYAKILLDKAEKLNDGNFYFLAFYKLGEAYSDKGNLSESINAYINGLKYASTEYREAGIYSNMAGVYLNGEDYFNSFKNARRAIKIFESVPDPLRAGTAILNIGYGYNNLNQLDSAYFYTNKAREIFASIDDQYHDYYWAYAEGNMALIKAKNQEYDEAENSLNTALEILIHYQDDYAICDYDYQLAKIYFERGEILRGLTKATSSFKIARKYGYKEFIRDGSEILSQFHRELDEYEKAYNYQSIFISYKDSLLNADLIRKLADQQKEMEVGQKQAELDVIEAQQKIERLILYVIAAFAAILFVLAFIIYKYYRSKSKVNKLLEDQKLKLESLNSTKDKFFSIISHDLRGPISSFFGISRMIKFFVKSKETDQLLEVADDIDQSVEQLSSLLDNLLSWAMQQQGDFPNNPTAVHVSEVASNVVSVFSNMAQSKEIRLSSKVPDELIVNVDKQMLETIIRNLVNNALKFTNEKGQVTLLAKQENDQIHIEVTDTGVGIPKEKLEQLFTLQENKSTYGTEGEKGLGLGLRLAYEFIASSHGSIQVESEEGKGTIFHIYLPTISV